MAQSSWHNAFYMSTPDNPNWANAYACYVNGDGDGDGRSDMYELIEISANFFP